MRKWNLRFGLTSRCNIRCRYCLPEGPQDVIVQPDLDQVVEVLQAARDIGITRVHYTGGEPTVRPDFLEILRAARDLGFAQQIVTTNGYRLHRSIEETAEAGLTRAIVSLDTLDPAKNMDLTRRGFHAETLRSVERCVEVLPTLTKISCVTMRKTLDELPAFVAYAREINSRGWHGRLAIKLNQFFPSNPAQLSAEGEEFWRDQFVDEATILDALARVGDLTPVPRESIEGDNPSYNYYEVGDTGVKVALLAMFSWGYPCGGCWKLRVSPNGITTSCISQKNPAALWEMTLDEKRDLFAQLIERRDNPQAESSRPERKHYRDQLGELRFDRVVGAERPIAHFESILRTPASAETEAGVTGGK